MRKYILVVEDNSDIREIVYLLLSEDYEVHFCEDATTFRNTIFKKRPDAVILDVMLPDGNGIDLCCEIKSDYRTGHIPVLMMSANSSLEEIKKKCNADDFIPKPFNIDHFINKVAVMVA
ncbi:response regulator transcription factor [Pedobacter sp. SG908]|uniref:response regulator transcription factor n=1 Tax=Pedobacter sp. SG908 TaxID=2587135 RepID=UPI001421DE06|nr:response regulator transcription factor [Pedobacter sp. SG908]NII83677.1 DNA-binding response OmpR family regulator [Pedobacter sp. SG908]